MTWVRLDDAVLSHPKVARAGVEAFALWVGGLAYANRHATDGHLPEHVLSILYPASGWSPAVLARLSRRLVDVGLWHSDERGGWMIHGYEEYQEEALRVSVEARRAAAKERKRAQRNRERGAFSTGIPPSHAVTPRDSKRDSACDTVRDSACDRSRDTSVTGASDSAAPREVVSQAPVPSRPVPSRSLSIESDVTARAESRTAGYERVRLALVAAYRAAGAMVPTRDLSIPHSSLLMSLADAFDGDATAMDETIAGFFADARARAEGWPLSWLAKNPNAYRRRPDDGAGSHPAALPLDLDDYEREAVLGARTGRYAKPGSKMAAALDRALARHPGVCPARPSAGEATA